MGRVIKKLLERFLLLLAIVKTHVRNILNKLSVDYGMQAAVKTMRERLVRF